MSGYRLNRVSELIKREISHYLFTHHSGSEVARASINGVRVSADFRVADVYVGVVGDEDQRQRVIDLLEADRAEIQSRLARRIRMRNTPHLRFRIDTAIERGTRVLELMKELGLEDEDPGVPSQSPPEADSSGSSGEPESEENR